MNPLRRAAALFAFAALSSSVACAANPRFISAGGGPRHWDYGTVTYATTPNDLSSAISHSSADSIVAAAAAIWSAVPTADIALVQSGALAEVVDGSNFFLTDTGFTMPADVASGGTGPQVAVLFDSDGAVTDAMLGEGASAPSNCRQSAVTNTVDAFSDNTNLITHAILVVNGRCFRTGSSSELSELQYVLLRAWGRVLGLGWSQLNDNVFTGSPQPTLDQLLDWPILHPIDLICGPYAFQCLQQPFTLRMDDISALSMLYPISRPGQSQLPGKHVTNQNALNIQGAFSFPDGQGMQGVNLEAHILYAGTGVVGTGAVVSAVTGYAFTGNAGTPVTGALAPDGLPRSQWGVILPSFEGAYDINEMDIDSSYNWLNVLLVPVAINPLYIGDYAVGPYASRQIAPSGSLGGFMVFGAGVNGGTWSYMTQSDAARPLAALDGTESSPTAVPVSGWWNSTLSTHGHTAWYAIHAPTGGTLAVEVTARDESGNAATTKMQPILGLWNAADSTGTVPDYAAASPFNSTTVATTTLRAPAGPLRLAIADSSGDGRPDFTYSARVLCATAVAPATLPAAGGSIAITGLGFRNGMKVTIGGTLAHVVGTTSNALAVTAPALTSISGASAGSALDMVVTDLVTGSSTTLPAAITYAPPPPTTTPLLELVNGGAQTIPSTTAYAQVVLEATDGAGNPVPGVAVTVDQQVTALPPACPSTGRCPPPALFSSGSLTLTTNSSGQISFSPLTVNGQSQTRILSTTVAGGELQTTLSHL